MGGGGRDSPAGRGLSALVVAFFALFCFLSHCFLLFLPSLLCKWSSHPETCAQRNAEDGGFPLTWLTDRWPRTGPFLLSFLGRISLGDGWHCLVN
jgi:hypothetical protein